MRFKALSLSALASLALVSGPAFADTFSGEITKIDRGSQSIEVQGDESQRKLRFFLARGGEVTRDGLPVQFAALQRGDRVEIDYARKGATHTARSVAVTPRGGAEGIAARE